ncbi:hypothetical protein ACOYW6_12435 [Parablastomonas sp. CN1-191]|uniref:hypothetical protein n=1 Tax=Parablastomonas sp. CN1-191 TaxID=3400908 RepID=UPI003BF7CCA1
MSTNIHTLRLAPVAIAATLAFATPAFAQEAVPAAAPAPAPAPAPTIVLPSFDPAPAPSAAPAATAPTTTASKAAPARSSGAAPADRTATRTATSHSASTSTARSAAPIAAAPVAAAPAAAAPLPNAEAAAPAPIDPAPVAVPAPAPAATTSPADNGNVLALAGLAGILALGGVAIAASRRRRVTADDYVEETAIDTPVAEVPVVASEPAESMRPAYEPAAVTPSYGEAAAAGIGAGALALQRVPSTPEGRAEMLDRMTRAEPDEANPFRSPKARRRRARLMMQGMIARQDQRGEPARSETRTGTSYDWNSLRPAAAPSRELTDA